MNSPVGAVDDRRAAATIATSLSGYVIAGALAIIGAEAAIFVLLLEGKQISFGLGCALVVTFLALFGSCYLGGFGIWTIYSDGFDGTWKIEVGNKFVWQLVLALLGIVLLFVAAILANSAAEKPKNKAAQREARQLVEQIAAANSDTSNRLGQVEKALDDVTQTCQTPKIFNKRYHTRAKK